MKIYFILKLLLAISIISLHQSTLLLQDSKKESVNGKSIAKLNVEFPLKTSSCWKDLLKDKCDHLKILFVNFNEETQKEICENIEINQENNCKFKNDNQLLKDFLRNSINGVNSEVNSLIEDISYSKVKIIDLLLKKNIEEINVQSMFKTTGKYAKSLSLLQKSIGSIFEFFYQIASSSNSKSLLSLVNQYDMIVELNKTKTERCYFLPYKTESISDVIDKVEDLSFFQENEFLNSLSSMNKEISSINKGKNKDLFMKIIKNSCSFLSDDVKKNTCLKSRACLSKVRKICKNNEESQMQNCVIQYYNNTNNTVSCSKSDEIIEKSVEKGREIEKKNQENEKKNEVKLKKDLILKRKEEKNKKNHEKKEENQENLKKKEVERLLEESNSDSNAYDNIYERLGNNTESIELKEIYDNLIEYINKNSELNKTISETEQEAIDKILPSFTNKDYINSIGTNNYACLLKNKEAINKIKETIEKNDCNLNINFLFWSFSKEGFSSNIEKNENFKTTLKKDSSSTGLNDFSVIVSCIGDKKVVFSTYSEYDNVSKASFTWLPSNLVNSTRRDYQKLAIQIAYDCVNNKGQRQCDHLTNEDSEEYRFLLKSSIDILNKNQENKGCLMNKKEKLNKLDGFLFNFCSIPFDKPTFSSIVSCFIYNKRCNYYTRYTQVVNRRVLLESKINQINPSYIYNGEAANSTLSLSSCGVNDSSYCTLGSDPSKEASINELVSYSLDLDLNLTSQNNTNNDTKSTNCYYLMTIIYWLGLYFLLI